MEHSLLFCGEPAVGINVSGTTMQDLNLDQIVNAIQEGDSFYKAGAMYQWFPKSKKEEQYRRDIFQALKGGAAWDAMNRFTEAMKEAHRTSAKIADVADKVQKQAWHLYGAHQYCRAVDCLWELLSEEDCRKAEGLAGFGRYVEHYRQSEAYAAMSGSAAALAEALYESPIVLSVRNNKLYVDRDMTRRQYDNGLKAYFSDEKRQCRSPFLGTPQFSQLEQEIISILAKKDPQTFRRLEAFCREWPDPMDKTVLRFETELQYYRLFLKFERTMEELGFPFAVPTADHAADMSAVGLYDLALASRNRHFKEQIVENDLYYGPDERFFVVTGPNQGGKTTFARSVGQMVYLSKMGFDVPAQAANVHFYRTILTHFSAEESVLTGKGKLKEELERLEPMMEQTEAPAFVIFNELFTTAANYDARIMGKRVLDYFIGRGCRGIYVTHLEELDQVSEKVAAMKAGVEEDGHTRTYKVERGRAASFGHAGDIVERHRLTYGQLKELLAQNEGQKDGKQ